MKKEKFDVTGMTCSACSSRVEKCVSKLSGAEKVSVNLLTNSMQVEYDENVLREGQIIDAVVKAGYGASVQGERTVKKEAVKGSVGTSRSPVEEQIKNMKMRLIVSFAFLIPLMYVSMGHMVGLPLPSFLDVAKMECSLRLLRFFLSSGYIRKQKVFYKRISDFIPSCSKYGQSDCYWFYSLTCIWDFCHLPYELWFGKWRYGACSQILSRSVF